MTEEPTIASGCGPVEIEDRPFARYVLQFQAHEEEEYQDAVNGTRWKMAVDEFARDLRHILKYREELPENTSGIEEAREMLFKILEDHGLTLYD